MIRLQKWLLLSCLGPCFKIYLLFMLFLYGLNDLIYALESIDRKVIMSVSVVSSCYPAGFGQLM